ncbi:MAG TPA: hypothetical protein VI461_15550 [Chitinophagaceae bacterium]|nr:hypothetical protein [Chitinophagaceae bacterium]
MKRFVLFFLFIISFFLSKAQIKWDGGGDGVSWNDGNNWVGNLVPDATDDVVLDNLAGEIASYTVTLPGGMVSVIVNSLTITPSGSNTITLINPVTNISPTAFTATRAGDAIVLNNGAILKNSSGASSGTPVGVTTTNFFRINNGGRYIHNCDRAHTTTLVARLSSVPGTENGTFEFDVPSASFTFSFNARVYGNLELSSTAQGGPVTYLSSGSAISTVNGNLIINPGVTLTLDFTNDIVINGNLIQNSSSVFNLSNSTANTLIKIKGNIISAGTITESGSGLPELYLNGTSNQNITAASINNSVTLTINNSTGTGATLLSAVTLPYKLKLLSGNITTTSTFLLTLTDDAIINGGSAISFVDGPMKKTGDEAFAFPIGEGIEYAPIEISGGGASNDEFIAEYFRGNPQFAIGGSYESPPIDHMSALEWWSLERAAGSSSKNITLHVRGYSNATLTSNLLVIRWNGSMWRNEGRTAFTGIAVGTVTSGIVTNFFPAGTPTLFTLGSDAAFPANPLPINLISFDVSKLSNTKSSINWELASCCPAEAKFEIQRAGKERDFVTIATVDGSATNRFYNYLDNGLKNGVNYYRLKMIEEDGKITYSRIVAVMNGVNGLLLTSLIPTVITTTATLSISSSNRQKLNIIITDMQGRVMKKQNLSVSAGNTTIEISAAGLSAGVYQLAGITAEGKTNWIRFINQ